MRLIFPSKVADAQAINQLRNRMKVSNASVSADLAISEWIEKLIVYGRFEKNARMMSSVTGELYGFGFQVLCPVGCAVCIYRCQSKEHLAVTSLREMRC